MCTHGIFFKSDNKTSVISNKIIFLTQMGKLQVKKFILYVEKSKSHFYILVIMLHIGMIYPLWRFREMKWQTKLFITIWFYTLINEVIVYCRKTYARGLTPLWLGSGKISIHSNYFEIFNHMQEVMIAVQPIFVLSANNFM